MRKVSDGHALASYPALSPSGLIHLTDAPVMTCGSVGLNVEMFANLFDDQEPSQLSIERDLLALAERIGRGALEQSPRASRSRSSCRVPAGHEPEQAGCLQ
jgi:hypothetical protein